MYSKILVPLDPAHPEKHADAIAVAKGLASDGAGIIGLVVTEHIPSYISNEVPGDLVKAADARARDLLAKAVATHGLSGGALLHGRPGNEIVEYAGANGIDCIVIASHKPDISDYLLGSTAGRVVRHARCAVHVMR